MTDESTQDSLPYLCKLLANQHKIKLIILLDKYDTPLHEAWFNGFWDKLINFMHGFIKATFKTNPYLGRALLTGITKIGVNNIEVVRTTGNFYTDCFGLTKNE